MIYNGYNSYDEVKIMSATLSITSNLKQSVDCQDIAIADIFRAVKIQHGVNIRLISLFFGLVAITGDVKSIYADFSTQNKAIAIDCDGELDQALARITKKEVASIGAFKALLMSSRQSITASSLLISVVIRQQQKFISKINELRTYIAEHDVDAENKYSQRFSNADELIKHLNS